METVIELDVPIEGKEVVFSEGVKFQRFFSVQPKHNRNVGAQITPNGLRGFTIRLFKEIQKRTTKDGRLIFFDPMYPRAAHVTCVVTGE